MAGTTELETALDEENVGRSSIATLFNTNTKAQ